MFDWFVLLTPLLVLPIVLLFVFLGCLLITEPPIPAPPPVARHTFTIISSVRYNPSTVRFTGTSFPQGNFNIVRNGSWVYTSPLSTTFNPSSHSMSATYRDTSEPRGAIFQVTCRLIINPGTGPDIPYFITIPPGSSPDIPYVDDATVNVSFELVSDSSRTTGYRIDCRGVR